MTTQSRSINKKSFYGAGESGSLPDIAMPPLDETPAIQSAAPNPWDNQPQQQNVQANPHFPVPDELPEEVEQAMAEQEESIVEEVVQQPTNDKMSQPQKQDHPNFKSIREAKERAEYERDLLLKQIYEMQAQQQKQQPVQQEEEPDIDFDIDEDALVEGKHVKKILKQFKKLEQNNKKQQEINAASIMESRIKSDFPDIDTVVSRENIERLRSEYPEIASSLNANPNFYEKASGAYKVIKSLGIYKDAVTRILDNDKAKAIANTQKPRPLSSVSPQQGDSPLSRANAFANGLTDDLKSQLRKEMMSARKNM